MLTLSVDAVSLGWALGFRASILSERMVEVMCEVPLWYSAMVSDHPLTMPG